MTDLKPDKGVIIDHLRNLFAWASADNKIEVRCIHPTTELVKSEFFGCHEYDNVSAFAAQTNVAGYNVYVTVNPLRPDVTSHARDTDVAHARMQFVDIDGTDDPFKTLDGGCGEFTPSLIVPTGSEPRTRLHAYWLMSEDVDLTEWSRTQKGLAARFGSDRTVTNPSRIMRLAGTISRPTDRKAGRGYIPEPVGLVTVAGLPEAIDVDRFRSAYPEPIVNQINPPPPAPLEWSLEAASGGCVPLRVIGRALAAIPPIHGQDRRQEWLALAMATKAANPNARSLFNGWQRNSDRYRPADDKVWDTIHPVAGSYPPLFFQATGNEPGWWRDDMLVAAWWRKHINEVYGTTESERASIPSREQRQPTEAFRRHKMSHLKDRPIPRWLIPNLLFQDQVAVMYAPPASFKSFVALDLCSRLVHGMSWQGKDLKPCRVLYVAGEGFPMFYNRRLAWFRHHGKRVHDDGLEVIDTAVNLTDSSAVLAFIVEMLKDIDGVKLIVFDTLSTCTAGLNESDSAVMSAAVENAKLIGKTLNSAVLLIHHPGKDVARGARGHSSLKGNIDAEWQVTRNEKQMRCVMRVTKQKDAEDGQSFHFEAHSVPLGYSDEDGMPMSSLALSPCLEPEARVIAIPGDAIEIEQADRETIARQMNAGDCLSVNAVANLICKALGCRVRTATDRIKAAVPTEWVLVELDSGSVEMRRELVNAQLQRIHIRGETELE